MTRAQIMREPESSYQSPVSDCVRYVPLKHIKSSRRLRIAYDRTDAAIKQLVAPPASPPKHSIGFHSEELVVIGSEISRYEIERIRIRGKAVCSCPFGSLSGSAPYYKSSLHR